MQLGQARERRASEAAKTDGQRMAREMEGRTVEERLEQPCSVSEWSPWGRAGGGAPNASVRLRDVRLHELYPEDELQVFSSCRSAFIEEGRCTPRRPRRSRRWHRTPRGIRLHSDALLRFEPGPGAGEMMRRAVDNDIRCRLTREHQLANKTLDQLVAIKKRALRDETKKDVEFEKRMRGVKSPWGRARPGGAAWRNPRDIGSNFFKDVGWTGDRTFGEIQGTYTKNKHVSLPKLDPCTGTSEVVATDLSKCALKLPPIARRPEVSVVGECGGAGVELGPLLARKRKLGARTLPSTDVTRRLNEPCQWRNNNVLEYLKDLNNQIKSKLFHSEESRKSSAQKCVLHQETWSGLWGRPGHGAPLPGHLQRNDLLALLYDTRDRAAAVWPVGTPLPLPPAPPVR